ncbi:sentrin-specific protease 8-like [Bacillus rossius redtenbacheri]|uniref:sentrin-specific protease 8-like n=1 Tax=Bacillus rossius redtenbacheri TaxID=93214 RepID=UPI002FDDD6D7
MANHDPVVLDFHDILVHQSDVELLRGPHWLNDTLISFYFAYLESAVYRDDRRFLFVCPDVTQCLKVSAARDMGVFLEPLKASERSFVFLAVNDCSDAGSPGGSHWSLLAYSRPENAFFHFDSMKWSNEKEARALARNLATYLCRDAPASYHEVDTSQQENGYDCGIHLVCNTEHVARFCASRGKIKDCGKVPRSAIATTRNSLLKLIQNGLM